MKKVILGMALVALSSGAIAEQLEANGSVVTVCSFSETVVGSLAISGTSVTTTSKPQTSILNNDPAFYRITVSNLDLAAPVTVSALTLDVTSPTVPAGAGVIFNGGNEVNGSVGDLALAGTYVLDANFTATLAATAEAGSYVATVDLTCAPI